MSVNTTAVRWMRREERKTVIGIGWRAFQSPIAAMFLPISLTPHTLVAEDKNGKLMGGAVLKAFRCAGQKVGLVHWIFTDPRQHGTGIGKALLDRAMEWFQEEKCDQIVAAVDGYNSRSWNLFEGKGFRYWSVSEQLHEFEWHWPAMLWGTLHFVDAGHFLLRLRLSRAAAKPGKTSGTGWKALVVTMLLLSLILFLAQVRQGDSSTVNLLELSVGSIAIMSLYVAIRLAGHAVTARTLGFSLQFRPWESGIILTLGIAAAFGWFFPYGGSFYLPKEKFRYNEACPAMGKIVLAGIIPSLLLLGAFVIWSELSSPVWVSSLGTSVGMGFGFFDTLFFFFPFQAMGGGHLWRWNRAVWLVTTMCFAAIAFGLPKGVPLIWSG